MGTKSDTAGNRQLPKRGDHHWSQELLNSIKNPKLICMEDELSVVIKDLYPKARHHYLVCPKEHIPSLKCLEKKHLNLLKHMHEIGRKIAGEHESQFFIGYHSVPSMVLLHLHVISDDFDSVHLKTKKHWNSFTTEFFLPSEKVIKELEEKGTLSHRCVAESKKLLQQDIKCHKCDFESKTMPNLKSHLKTHLN